jgi:hypothetical protein
MSNTIPAEIKVQTKTTELYIQANREIEKRLGRSPGAEFLMSLVVERENPMDVADFYCDTVFTEVQPA